MLFKWPRKPDGTANFRSLLCPLPVDHRENYSNLEKIIPVSIRDPPL